MKTVLLFVPNYFPGYMSGGIARSVLNTTEWLGEEVRILIVTQDRDWGSDTPYDNVARDCWVPLGKAQVRYLTPEQLTLGYLTELVRATPHDVLHLNSFLDPTFTIKLLLLRRLGKISSPLVVLSPRGEFGHGSLRLKYPKKKIYIELSRGVGFYNGVFWHASSKHEADDIATEMRVPRSSIRSALDLPVKDAGIAVAPDPEGERLKVVYLARLTREKNLDGALRILQGVKVPITFDIVGPREDPKYGDECDALVAQLPANVEARYLGPVAPEDVFEMLSRYDLSFLPSHGENYGHTIAESISVGTRVLISHTTPWHNLKDDGLGWDIHLDDTARFVEVIHTLAAQSAAERASVRPAVRRAAAVRLFDPVALADNRLLYSPT
jgi:glycosyltransferase involved in cell wall biosynthesis